MSDKEVINERVDELYRIIASLKTKKDVEDFFIDLCTYKEIEQYFISKNISILPEVFVSVFRFVVK